MEAEVVEMEEVEMEEEGGEVEVEVEEGELDLEVVLDPEVVEARYLVHLLPKNNVFLFLSNTAQTSLLKSAALAPSRSASMYHLLNLQENAEPSLKPTANQGKHRNVSHPPKASAELYPKVSVSGYPRHPAPQPLRLWMCTLVSSKQLDLLM